MCFLWGMNINLIYFRLTGGVTLKFNLRQWQIPYLAKFYTRTFLCKIWVCHGCDLEEYGTLFCEETFCIFRDISCRLVIFAVHICRVENCSETLKNFYHSIRYFIPEDNNLMWCNATTGSPGCGFGKPPFSFVAEQCFWRLDYGPDNRGTMVLFPSAVREFPRRK